MDKVVKKWGGQVLPPNINVVEFKWNPKKTCHTQGVYKKNALVKNAIVKGVGLQESAITVECNGQIGEHWA